jgi:2TM domain
MQGMQDVVETRDPLREAAVESLKKKAEFRAHLLAYVLVNAFLVAVWSVTGAGFFWPVFPIAGWGIGLVLHAWDTYRKQAPTEQDIRREMDRLRSRSGTGDPQS